MTVSFTGNIIMTSNVSQKSVNAYQTGLGELQDRELKQSSVQWLLGNQHPSLSSIQNIRLF